MFKYGNYIAKLEVNPDTGMLHGKVLNISATIAFEGTTVKEAEQKFQEAVDAYVQSCQAQGKEPEKPFSGKLPFRTTPEIHRDIYIAASRADKSINAWMEDTLSNAARQKNNQASLKSDQPQSVEISIAEYRQLLAQLEKKLNQLQEAAERHIERKPGSFAYFLKDIKPFLKDKELPDLIEKIETFNEQLKSTQTQKYALSLIEETPTPSPVSNPTPNLVTSVDVNSSVPDDADIILQRHSG